jgi:MoaA/NifB/PqqE/SkfB family radical SAM enzyme
MEKRSDNSSTRKVKEQIVESKKYGLKNLCFNGGEPTIRKDLIPLVKFAKKCGYQNIKIQSNGMRFRDKAYVDSIISAGANIFHMSVHGHNSEIHDRLTMVPGSFKMAVEGIRNLIERGAEIELDIIVTKLNYKELLGTIKYFEEAGVKSFNFWFVNIEGKVFDNINGIVPRMSDAAHFLKECFDYCSRNGLRCYSLYIPYCFFAGYEDFVFNPKIENVVLIDTQRTLKLEKSTLEHGIKIEKCKGCRHFSRCFGISENYVKHFGDGEIKPV